MSRRPRETLECRDYAMPPDFPVVVLTGEVLTMPGLPLHPAAEQVDVVDGKVVGLF